MQLELLDGDLRRLLGERGYRPRGWTDAEIRHVLLVAQCADAATTPSDLYGLRLLGLRPRSDDESAAASVRLSAERGLTLTFKSDSIPMIMVFDVIPSRTEESQ